MNETNFDISTSRGRWLRAIAAIILTVAITQLAALGGVVAATLFDRWAGIAEAGVQPPGAIESWPARHLGIYLVAFQAGIIALTLFATRVIPGGASGLLPFHMPQRPVIVLFGSVLTLIGLAIAGGALVYALDRNAFVADMKPFAEMAHTNAWLILLLAASIGAPFAEEMLFRGLLFGGLRPSPLGAVGATVISAFMWAGMHANYSSYGLLAVLLIGLYFGWLRERTGSLIPSLVCHAVYNGSIVLALAFSQHPL